MGMRGDSGGGFEVVLVWPEIPPNTGNVARLCAATGSRLHLVGPLGFDLSDKALKRAGMDYWKWVEWKYHESLDDFLPLLVGRRFHLVENNTARLYTEARFDPGDFLVFGRETKGLPESLLEAYPESSVSIPVFRQEAELVELRGDRAL